MNDSITILLLLLLLLLSKLDTLNTKMKKIFFEELSAFALVIVG